MCWRKLCLFLSCNLLILIVHILQIAAVCNICSKTTNITCVSNTQFQICVGDEPVGPVNSCPTGYVCASDAGICQPSSASVLLPCNECHQCNDNLTFACTSPTTFALCLGTTIISNISAACPSSLVCQKDAPEICVPTVLGATCSFYDDAVMTTPATVDPTALCSIYQRPDRYAYSINATTICRQYIGCHIFDGVWNGAIYTCPGSTYFNSTLGLCTATAPLGC